MKAAFYIFILFISILNPLKAEWYTQSSGTTANLNSVYFPVLNTGYISGDNGTILKTINNGGTWIPKVSGTTSSLYSIYFLNTNTGFAGGDNIILKTTDAGNTWISQNINLSVKSIYFVNSSLGFAAGTNGAILKSTNGGNSWNVNILDPAVSFTSVCFTDMNNGYVVGLESRYYKTTDGGLTWVSKNTSVSKNFYSIQFINGVGYIAGGWAVSAVLRSYDMGETWQNLLTGNFGVRLYSSYFIDEYTGYTAGRYGVIMKTVNSGVNWQIENTGTSEYLYSLNFISPETGFAVGANGTILSTVSLIGIKPISSEIPKAFSLSQNYPNPFNPETKIQFNIPLSGGVAENRGVFVKLNIYDILGREISTLVNEHLKAGVYSVNWNALNYPSGVYFCKLQAGNYSNTKRMVLLK